MLVNSDFTSKDTSLWLFGICTVLMASIKFSVDFSLWSERQSVVSKFWLSVWTVGMSEIHRMKQWVSSMFVVCGV